MPSLRQIRYFLGVADKGQVSAAAAQLNISQSAITIAIKDLEEELGVSLFRRHKSGLALTYEGGNFISHARNIEASVADAVSSMRQQSTTVSGEVRLGVTNAPSGYLLFPILARFKRSHPDIFVRVFEYHRPKLQEMILGGDLDIGIMLVSNLTERKRFNQRILLKSQRGLWLSSAHPLMKKEEISFSDIANEPFVLMLEDEADQSAQKYWKKFNFEPNITYTTETLEAVRAIVATGQGVTILSELTYRAWSLDGGRVEMRSLKEDIPTMDVGLVWKSNHPLTDAESRLCEYLVEACR